MITQLVVSWIIIIAINTIKWYKINVSKQQALDADPKVVQQINFTGNLDPPEAATMFFITKEAKETISDFLQIFKYCNFMLF